MPFTTVRVDLDVWQSLIKRQARLTLERGRVVSMSDTVKDILRETAEAAATGVPAGQEEKDAS
jgi:hypothetical protein